MLSQLSYSPASDNVSKGLTRPTSEPPGRATSIAAMLAKRALAAAFGLIVVLAVYLRLAHLDLAEF